MKLARRSVLLLPLLAAACGEDGAPAREAFPPLTYEFLTKLRLNVASIELAPLPPPDRLDGVNPAPPGPALIQMAQDRLAAGGSLGSAVFTVETASIMQGTGGLDGALAVRLDVRTSEGTRAGFAQAQVSRRAEGTGSDLRASLYDITARMMQDMNVEFEFQIRQSLRDWLQDTGLAPPPAPVEQQPLSSPGRPAL